MLPYSIEVLFAVFGQYNKTVWPAQLLAYVLALVALAIVFKPRVFKPSVFKPSAAGTRFIGVVQAIAWAWVGIGFHFVHFAPLNFAAPIYGTFFVLQALLLAWAGLIKASPGYRFHADVFGVVGQGLVIYALVGYPVVDWLMGQDWRHIRSFAMAPGPTMLFTLGLLLSTNGRTPLYLAIIPLLWGLVAGASAWLLGLSQDLVLPLAGIGGLGLIVWKNRRHVAG